jgi:hypothetical protein
MLGNFEIILDIKSKSVKAHQFFHQILGLKSTLLAKLKQTKLIAQFLQYNKSNIIQRAISNPNYIKENPHSELKNFKITRWSKKNDSPNFNSNFF